MGTGERSVSQHYLIGVGFVQWSCATDSVQAEILLRSSQWLRSCRTAHVVIVRYTRPKITRVPIQNSLVPPLPQFAFQEFVGPTLGESGGGGIIMCTVMPRESVMLAWIAVNDCARNFC